MCLGQLGFELLCINWVAMLDRCVLYESSAVCANIISLAYESVCLYMCVTAAVEARSAALNLLKLLHLTFSVFRPALLFSPLSSLFKEALLFHRLPYRSEQLVSFSS